MPANGRLLWFLLLLASASNAVFFSADGEGAAIGGGRRSLMVALNDYGEPAANRGHDPPSFSNKGGSGNGGGNNGGAGNRSSLFSDFISTSNPIIVLITVAFSLVTE